MKVGVCERTSASSALFSSPLHSCVLTADSSVLDPDQHLARLELRGLDDMVVLVDSDGSVALVEDDGDAFLGDLRVAHCVYGRRSSDQLGGLRRWPTAPRGLGERTKREGCEGWSGYGLSASAVRECVGVYESKSKQEESERAQGCGTVDGWGRRRVRKATPARDHSQVGLFSYETRLIDAESHASTGPSYPEAVPTPRRLHPRIGDGGRGRERSEVWWRAAGIRSAATASVYDCNDVLIHCNHGLRGST